LTPFRVTVLALALSAALGACSNDTSQAQSAPSDRIAQGSGFDFYVLSLSWSPTFCASDQSAGNRQQCAENAGYGFIVHGLWPQFERGYPEFCENPHDDRVDARFAAQLADIMPGMGLIGHQWRKHGSCTGLDHDAYFSTVRDAWRSVQIPEPFQSPDNPASLAPQIVEEAFIAANDGLTPDAIAVTCDSARLQEVRICLTRTDLSFRSCPEVNSRSCGLERVDIPPLR
jgi:ribonuclease T2